MRIVSENGMRDVPYDCSVLMICDEYYIVAAMYNGDKYRLAHSETLKRARAAMDLIREAYQKDAKVVYMDYIMEEVREEC